MNSGNFLILGIQGTSLSQAEITQFSALLPAGYILFSRNIESPAQTRALTDALREIHRNEQFPPIISIDQEGGRVTRTKEIAPALPSAPELAAHAQTKDPHSPAKAGALTAELLRQLGINLNFAPVLDVDHFPNEQNALRERCWGTDPQRIIDFAGSWNRWHRKRDVLTCAKHFPACGRAQSDPHHSLPSSPATIAELLACDILPYTALMPELDSIMLAHVNFPELDPDLPASLSPIVVQKFLRDQLGFENHLVLTDDLDMGAITQRFGRGEDAKLAIAAGNDIALICHATDTAHLAANAIAQLPDWQLEIAHKRIQRVRKKIINPIAWSEKSWEKTCAAIQQLRDETPPILAHPTANDSPVNSY